MGQEVVKLVKNNPEFALVGGVDPSGRQVADETVFPDLASALLRVSSNVVVDFTTPQAVQANGNLLPGSNPHGSGNDRAVAR